MSPNTIQSQIFAGLVRNITERRKIKRFMSLLVGDSTTARNFMSQRITFKFIFRVVCSSKQAGGRA
jgi:hypothetical protein